MRQIKNFGILCLLALFTMFFYWASSILGSETFIPYVMATVFTGIFLFFATCLTEGQTKVLTTICTMAMSLILFFIARWMDMEETKFYYSQDWDGCESSPALAVVTWGWQIQIILTCLIGWATWRFHDPLAKFGEAVEKKSEPTDSRL